MYFAPVSPEQLEWERSRSRSVTSDAIWKLDVYRAALFLLHAARVDHRAIKSVPSMHGVASQLLRAAASVSANLSEGYSRSTRSDRIRFLDYALGSTRECVSWDEASRDVLGAEVIEQRLQLLTQIRAKTLGLIRSARERKRASHFEP